MLLHAWSSLAFSDAVLYIAAANSSTEYSRILMSKAKAVPNTVILGEKEAFDNSIYTSKKWTVLASSREGHSNVLCEAFGYGSVVIGSAIPGIQEHVNPSRGLLFDGTLSSLKIALLAAYSISATDYLTMRKSAYDYAKANSRDCQLHSILSHLGRS